MANNKVQLANGIVLIDLTSDTVDASHLALGYTAHDASGAAITGTLRSVLTGLKVPSASLGKNGDFYVQAAKIGTLTSDKHSYINTGITQNALYKVEIEAQLGSAVSGSYDTFFGCRNGNNARFTARFNNGANGALEIHKSTTPTTSYTTGSTGLTKNSFVGTYHKITVRDYCAMDGLVTYGLATSNTTDFPYPIFVFANNDRGTAGDYASASVKTWKMWNSDGELIQFLIPAEDDQNVACMYDLMTDTYFYNSGSGSFYYTAGTVSRGAILWLKEGGSWSVFHVYDTPI